MYYAQLNFCLELFIIMATAAGKSPITSSLIIVVSGANACTGTTDEEICTWQTKLSADLKHLYV